MTRAFAYARVSTGEQSKGFSLEAQFGEIERFCSERGIEIIDRYSDSMSGTKLTERLALMEMLQRVEDTRPDFVIATESDRISRDTLQFGWINTHLSMKGVKLLLVNERPADGPAEKAFQKIRVVFSEFETDLRQWRINRGRLQARAHNRFMNRPPFGYVMKGKEIIPDSTGMVVVTKVFTDYCKGVPIKQLARELGLNPSSIRYLLGNRFYIDSGLRGRHELFLEAGLFYSARERLTKSKKAVQELPPLSSGDKSENYL